MKAQSKNEKISMQNLYMTLQNVHIYIIGISEGDKKEKE